MSNNKGGAMTIHERIKFELENEQKAKEQLAKQEEPQMIEYHPLEHDIEDSLFSSFMNSAANQSIHFVTSLFGGTYVAQNKFTFAHKFKIVKYLQFRNNILSGEVQKKFRKQNNEQELIKLLKQQNRVILVSNLSECRNRIGWNGYAWGLFGGSLFMMLNISIWRKLALCVTTFHIFGSYVNYSNLDRIFDKIYPFFVSDLNEYKIEKQNEILSSLKRSKMDQKFEDTRLKMYFEDLKKNKNKREK